MSERQYQEHQRQAEREEARARVNKIIKRVRAKERRLETLTDINIGIFAFFIGIFIMAIFH